MHKRNVHTDTQIKTKSIKNTKLKTTIYKQMISRIKISQTNQYEIKHKTELCCFGICCWAQGVPLSVACVSAGRHCRNVLRLCLA